MNEDVTTNNSSSFSRRVGEHESRKLKARRRAIRSVWLGFGMFGLVGWSVAVPTVIGAVLGHWLDKHHPASHSWTLTLLVAGLSLGCMNAWRWVAREHRQMEDEREEHNE